MRAGAIQPNYIPWRGYFDFIDCSDVFVLLDDLQYTRRDWRNRNKIKSKDGVQWLTIPVLVKGKYTQTIAETRVSSHEWSEQHRSAMRHAYAKAPYFKTEWPWIDALYSECAQIESLAEIDARFIRAVCNRLEIRTPIHSSSEFDLPSGKNDRLIELCRLLGADTYLSGPSARAYIDEAQWRDRGVDVRYKAYAYGEYPQLHPPFEPYVTVLDLILNTGPLARRYAKSAVDLEPR